MKSYYFIALLGLLATVSAQEEGSVVFSDGIYSFVEGVDDSAVAFGTFNDTLLLTGWGTLKIETNQKYDDREQMFAAGFLEGYMTAIRIEQQYMNMYYTFESFFNETDALTNLYDFLKKQDKWTRSMIASNKQDPYWKQVDLIMGQYDGLIEGFNQAAPNSSVPMPFGAQLLNGVGDFLDLLPALNVQKRIDYYSMTPKELRRTLAKNGHCSGLIKVPGDLSDLWAAHSSWFTFGSTNRIYKHYNFRLNASFVSARKMSFSSYPGFLESLDDFYIMDNGLVMVQTTNSIINQSLYEKVTHDALFAWQRVRLCNHMARDGMEWGELFSKHNSGTYNNQYMVVDYNKFIRGQELKRGTLVVVEQIPGLVVYDDQTHQLERGYWASYNVPYYESIYDASGYPGLVEQYGPSQSYQMAPRAEIFRRDQATVVDLESLQAIMRYNDYKNDPYSAGDPGNAICSRFDLESENPGPFGCYDSKVTSYELMMNMTSFAINGPTTSHGLPPFEWTAEFNSTAHFGEPFMYNFSFVEMNPEWTD